MFAAIQIQAFAINSVQQEKMLTTKLYVKTQQITGEMDLVEHMIHLISDSQNLLFLGKT